MCVYLNASFKYIVQNKNETSRMHLLLNLISELHLSHIFDENMLLLRYKCILYNIRVRVRDPCAAVADT